MTKTCINSIFRVRNTRCRPLTLLCLLAALSINGASQKRIATAPESLEWITWDCDLIVLGYPQEVEPGIVRADDSLFEELVTIRVDRVLYGSYAPKSLSFRWQTDRARSMKREVDSSREPNVTYDRPQLFFLRQSSKQQADGDDLDFRLRSNILIKQSAQGLPTATRGFAKTADEILRVVEDESSNRITNSLGMNTDPGLDSFSRTRGLAQDCFECIAPRGAVMIRVSPTENVVAPALARFQADALDLCHSPDYRERERGVFMLRSYPDETTRRTLTSLLQDDGAYRWNMSSTTECATYMVRAAAYDVLRDQGVVVPKPLLDICHGR